MLFDYLAEKHNVSSADVSIFHCISHAICVNPWLFWRGGVGRPKTLNSFSGFVWLAQILWTFTFCGELLRINGVARDKSRKNAGGSIFAVMFGLLPFPFIGPLPLWYSAQGPSANCGKGLGGLERPLQFLVILSLREWPDIAHTAVRW